MRTMWMRRVMIGLVGSALLHAPSALAVIGDARAVVQELAPAAELPDFRPPVVERTLANGMRCFFIEDHLLPLVRFTLIFPGGAIYDPPEKIGLFGLLATMLRTGGTIDRSPQSVDEYLDAHAIDLDVTVGWEQGTATVSALSEALPEALPLLLALLYTPRFDADRFALARKNFLGAIARQNEQPAPIAARIFRKLLYGAKSPWAATAQAAAVERMTVDDLQSLHAALFAPQQMYCAAAGDFHVAELVAQLDQLLAQYPERAAVAWTPPAAPVTPRAGLFFAPKALPQAVVTMGHRGLTRDDPDKFPLYVANEVLGSPATFTSWLVSEIRTARGLAYEAWSALQLGPFTAPGTFQAHAKTRSAAMPQTVALMRQQITRMADGTSVDDADVRAMKDALLRRMVFQYADPFAVVRDMAQYVYLGLPSHYGDIFREGIRMSSLADVRRVVRQKLHPEQLTTVVVGDPATVLPELKTLGPVEELTVEEW